jgi:hypothetical protein
VQKANNSGVLLVIMMGLLTAGPAFADDCRADASHRGICLDKRPSPLVTPTSQYYSCSSTDPQTRVCKSPIPDRVCTVDRTSDPGADYGCVMRAHCIDEDLEVTDTRGGAVCCFVEDPSRIRVLSGSRDASNWAWCTDTSTTGGGGRLPTDVCAGTSLGTCTKDIQGFETVSQSCRTAARHGEFVCHYEGDNPWRAPNSGSCIDRCFDSCSRDFATDYCSCRRAIANDPYKSRYCQFGRFPSACGNPDRTYCSPTTHGQVQCVAGPVRGDTTARDVCMLRGAEHGACEPIKDPPRESCLAGLVCYPSTHVCVRPGKVGQPCERYGPEGPLIPSGTCGGGLVCNAKGFCDWR